MQLYLVRHGDAASPAVDPARGLTAHGRAQAENLAAWAAGQGVRVEAILHSPKARAAQTAEILARAVRSNAPPAVQAGLLPEDDVRAAAGWLAHETRDLLLVGHLPFMGLLAGLLVRGSPSAPVVSFTTGTLAHLERSADGSWTLIATHSPRV